MAVLPSAYFRAHKSHPRFSTGLGLVTFFGLALTSLYAGLHKQHFSRDSVLQHHIQRVRNLRHHGMYRADYQLPEEHRDHDKCADYDINYPMKD